MKPEGKRFLNQFKRAMFALLFSLALTINPFSLASSNLNTQALTHQPTHVSTQAPTHSLYLDGGSFTNSENKINSSDIKNVQENGTDFQLNCAGTSGGGCGGCLNAGDTCIFENPPFCCTGLFCNPSTSMCETISSSGGCTVDADCGTSGCCFGGGCTPCGVTSSSSGCTTNADCATSGCCIGGACTPCSTTSSSSSSSGSSGSSSSSCSLSSSSGCFPPCTLVCPACLVLPCFPCACICPSSSSGGISSTTSSSSSSSSGCTTDADCASSSGCCDTVTNTCLSAGCGCCACAAVPSTAASLASFGLSSSANEKDIGIVILDTLKRVYVDFINKNLNKYRTVTELETLPGENEILIKGPLYGVGIIYKPDNDLWKTLSEIDVIDNDNFKVKERSVFNIQGNANENDFVLFALGDCCEPGQPPCAAGEVCCGPAPKTCQAGTCCVDADCPPGKECMNTIIAPISMQCMCPALPPSPCGSCTCPTIFGVSSMVGESFCSPTGLSVATCVCSSSPGGCSVALMGCTGGMCEGSYPCATCMAVTAVCGDGTVTPPEDCDDGNTNNGDGCDATCMSECGNGVVDAGEQCESVPPITNTAGCDYDCTLPECGDGNTNNAAGENCDTGVIPSADTATCDDDCTNPICGDGHINMALASPEQCDDGNIVSGDGCSSTCMTETMCGDNNVDAPAEDCDPPPLGAENSNTCDNDCTNPLCGDGLINTSFIVPGTSPPKTEMCDPPSLLGTPCNPQCQNVGCVSFGSFGCNGSSSGCCTSVNYCVSDKCCESTSDPGSGNCTSDSQCCTSTHLCVGGDCCAPLGETGCFSTPPLHCCNGAAQCPLGRCCLSPGATGCTIGGIPNDTCCNSAPVGGTQIACTNVGGTATCCNEPGGSCTANNNCCPGSSCTSGMCCITSGQMDCMGNSSSCCDFPFATCDATNTCCVGNGNMCNSNADCCMGLKCNLTSLTCEPCVVNGSADCMLDINNCCDSGVGLMCDGGTTCCFESGGMCNSNIDCCMSLFCDTALMTCTNCITLGNTDCMGDTTRCCNSGTTSVTCSATTNKCCIPANGMTCANPGQCCDSALTCDTTGKCCKGLGTACTSFTECCNNPNNLSQNLTCGPNATSGSNCCVWNGDSCTNPSDCCFPGNCVGGMCVTPTCTITGLSSCSSRVCPAGQTCFGTLSCGCCVNHGESGCSGLSCCTTTDTCTDNKCCRSSGQSCSAPGDCCINSCPSGTCCLPVGGMDCMGNSANCCIPGLECSGDTCCKSTGQACTAATATECCSGLCSMTNTCCIGLMTTCSANTDCCSNICDTTAGPTFMTCIGPPGCTPTNAGNCPAAGMCCEDPPLACNPGNPCCIPTTNAGCTGDAQCCEAPGAMCVGNMCCHPSGSPCGGAAGYCCPSTAPPTDHVACIGGMCQIDCNGLTLADVGAGATCGNGMCAVGNCLAGGVGMACHCQVGGALALGAITVTTTGFTVAGNNDNTSTSLLDTDPFPGSSFINAFSNFFDVSTTNISPSTYTITVNYEGFAQPEGYEIYDIKLVHGITTSSSGWVDITTSNDTTSKIITGITNSLSPFAVGFLPQSESSSGRCTLQNLSSSGSEVCCTNSNFQSSGSCIPHKNSSIGVCHAITKQDCLDICNALSGNEKETCKLSCEHWCYKGKCFEISSSGSAVACPLQVLPQEYSIKNWSGAKNTLCSEIEPTTLPLCIENNWWEDAKCCTQFSTTIQECLSCCKNDFDFLFGPYGCNDPSTGSNEAVFYTCKEACLNSNLPVEIPYTDPRDARVFGKHEPFKKLLEQRNINLFRYNLSNPSSCPSGSVKIRKVIPGTNIPDIENKEININGCYFKENP